jgi:hypothetical protein
VRPTAGNRQPAGGVGRGWIRGDGGAGGRTQQRRLQAGLPLAREHRPPGGGGGGTGRSHRRPGEHAPHPRPLAQPGARWAARGGPHYLAPLAIPSRALRLIAAGAAQARGRGRRPSSWPSAPAAAGGEHRHNHGHSRALGSGDSHTPRAKAAGPSPAVRRAPGWRGWTCAAAGSTRRRGAGCSPSCPRAWRLCSATSNRKVAANLWPRHLNLVLARLCCRRHEYIRIGEAGACNINVAPSIAASVEHARLTERPAATAPGPWPLPWPPLPVGRPAAAALLQRPPVLAALRPPRLVLLA